VATTPDPILQVLIGLNLQDRESEFRGMLDALDSQLSNLQQRDLVIAALGTLMLIAAIPWPIVLRSVKSLGACSDERLSSDGCGVAIMNGSVLLVPTEDSIEFYQLPELRLISDPPETYVTNLYTVPSVWKRVGRILGE